MSDINPVVLQNKGVPVTLYSVEPYVRISARPTVVDGKIVQEERHTVAWRPVKPEGSDEPVTFREFVRFDNASLAAIETYFGSLEKFKEVGDSQPHDAVCKALAAMLGHDLLDDVALAQVAAQMIPAESNTYQVAIQVGLAVANGVDPTQGVELYREARRVVALSETEQAKEMGAMLAEMRAAVEEAEAEAEQAKEPEGSEPEADTPGSDGSEPGSESDEATTSSGD